MLWPRRPSGRQFRKSDPSLHVSGVTLQSARIDESILQERLLALLGGFFGLIAVVLAAMGLHGVLSYSVVRRTPRSACGWRWAPRLLPWFVW